MLSDRDIKRYLSITPGQNGWGVNEQPLEIDPLTNPELQIQPASVDLTLGNTFIIPNLSINQTNGQPTIHTDRKVEVPEGGVFEIYPGDFVLAVTRERVKLPNYLSARAEGRSSIGRLGLLIHLTAGFIDPGFNGCITLELVNLSKTTIALTPGMRICQLALFELSSPCERPYGAERGSKYVGEQTGPETSKMQQDAK